MLTNQTIEKLISLKLDGMAESLRKQGDSPELRTLSFDDRLGLLVDAEYAAQENAKFTSRVKQAGLKQSACLEDVDLQNGLDRTTLTLLSQCTWVKQGIPILIDGKTGVGKSYLSTALAHKACRCGFTALYFPRTQGFSRSCGKQVKRKVLPISQEIGKNRRHCPR